MSEWHWHTFDELSNSDLHAALAARQDVFIVEQNCVFADIDGLDPGARHLLGWQSIDGRRQLAAYLRLLAPGAKYAEMSLGRILTTAPARGSGIGRELVAQGIAYAERLYPGQPCRIGAQQRLERFYAGFGFQTVSEPYDEDGILHVDMLR
ncbi:MAG: GNAT family N-acetyltransferase [Pseudomonadota bacterium]